ncbi:hypothetical protein SO802_006115 [Lithocarpus litseifolius]|uniref:Zinc knuckle CX2CX4HX4C domain-containing protein n=1 Tax=Lithocarpus litseifolius TaxID=425828 RepID=A0AAW2DKE6_9ROSI
MVKCLSVVHKKFIESIVGLGDWIWSYDKIIVAFQRVTTIEAIPFLGFSFATFWVQIHNVLEKKLTPETGEAIGKTIGSVVQVADTEDDGSGGEFLRVQVVIDLSKPLPRCYKLWVDGKQIGWFGIRYERLSNFCYWCGRVTLGSGIVQCGCEGGSKRDFATAMEAGQIVNVVVDSKR